MARERDDNDALTLVGAVIGPHRVTGRFHTGKRWQYAVENVKTGRTGAMRGYELVRLCREAEVNGLTIVMPTSPWRAAQ
jgi:hypothetical protein